MPTPLPGAGYPSADGIWTGLRDADGADLAIVVEDGRIAWIGTPAALAASEPAAAPATPATPATPAPRATQRPRRHFDGGGALVTPGLIDCHVHLVYGGQRANEFAERLAGASYEAIARAGGGIVSSVLATRAADEDALFAQSAPRLEQLLADGVCALEIKSGYGLALEHERKQLRVARRLGEAYGVTVRTTFLGAHALPPEYAGRSGDYIARVCEEMLPALAAEGLVDAVDVFCERIAFSLAETERVLRAAQALGLPVKLHAEQLSDMGGAALAARYGALSCDHLEYLSADGIAAMRRAGTVAVLLPGAYYALRDDHPPPIAALREAGIPMAVATDHNPGSSPALSLLLMANMACTLFRLTVPEAIDGITRHAARALGLADSHGVLAVGTPANFALWNVADRAELAYWFGQRPLRAVVRQGRIAIGAGVVGAGVVGAGMVGAGAAGADSVDADAIGADAIGAPAPTATIGR
ncbi:MAG: imidazolonepropionase [Lautropia sp.]